MGRQLNLGASVLMKQRPPSTARIGRFFGLVLPALIILLVGIIAILGFLVYKISYPGEVPESVDPSHYLLPSLEVSIPAGKGGDIPGWWIPGLKGAPGIILAPGYGMCRSDALSLAVALHENGFNILIYDQRGSGASPRGASTLGLYESADMTGAVQFLQGRPESNLKRIGIWGVDVGALAALKATANFPEIRAIVADSVFQSPSDFLSDRIEEDFGLNNRILQIGCYQLFRLSHVFGSLSSSDELPMQALSDRNILFIKGENRKRLGYLTTNIYNEIKPHKEMISFKTARVHAMSGEDLKSYDRQVANFFHLNLQ
jgi:pimeloyl-ACP methyl ester carboxylesterase